PDFFAGKPRAQGRSFRRSPVCLAMLDSKRSEHCAKYGISQFGSGFLFLIQTSIAYHAKYGLLERSKDKRASLSVFSKDERARSSGDKRSQASIRSRSRARTSGDKPSRKSLSLRSRSSKNSETSFSLRFFMTAARAAVLQRPPSLSR